jgi:hypothetical protein
VWEISTYNTGGAIIKYIGIDFHKNYSFVTKMDEAGRIGYQTKLSNDYDTLKSYLTDLQPRTKIAIEATSNWYYFYELIEGHDLEVVLSALTSPSLTATSIPEYQDL